MKFTKYIVVSDVDGNIERMIIFPSSMKHSTMAKAMKRQRLPNVISAGFIDEFMKCYGESLTVRSKSRGQKDTDMLHKELGINDKKLVFRS